MRAGAAQLAQLRSINPPLSETEITREQLALEEAVQRVEAEVTDAAGDAPIPANRDLLMAADEIGKPIARARDHSSIAQAKVLANPFSPAEMPLPMMVRGGATARLIGYWRFRSLPPRGTA